MSTTVLADAGSGVINLDQPGTYLHWSIFTVSVANLVLIAVMVVIFGVALVLPFPKARTYPPAEESACGGRSRHARGFSRAAPGPTWVRTRTRRMWTYRLRRWALRLLPPGKLLPGPPARLRRLLDICVRRGQPRRARGGDRVRVRHRGRRGGLVAHQPGGPFLQQPAPVERGAVHGLPGHPPVGEVLDGCLAGPPGDDLDHRGGRLRGLGRGVLHRLPDAAELRLAMDLRQRQGRLQPGRHRRVL